MLDKSLIVAECANSEKHSEAGGSAMVSQACQEMQLRGQPRAVLYARIHGDVAWQCTVCVRQSGRSQLRLPDVPADQKAGASLLIEVRSESARVSSRHV